MRRKVINQRSHYDWLNRIPRIPLALLGWLGGAICSFNITIANIIFKDFYRQRVKFAIRRAGWLVKRSWLRLTFFKDERFYFSQQLTIKELIALEVFLQKAEQRTNNLEYLSDTLFLLADKIHELIRLEGKVISPATKNCITKEDIEEEISRFKTILFSVLGSLRFNNNLPLSQKGNGHPAKSFSQESARIALEDFAQLFPLDKYPWYVISGTFLGLYRDGGFMAHDYDLDFGVHRESTEPQDWTKALKNSHNFVLTKIDNRLIVNYYEDEGFSLEEEIAIIKLTHTTGVKIDLFFHYQDEGNRWHGSSIHSWYNKEFSLIEDRLAGVKVLRPKEAERYLTENYGQWQTPVKDFNCSTGTPNLKLTPNYYSHAYFIRQMLITSKYDVKEAKKLKALLLASSLLNRDFNYD